MTELPIVAADGTPRHCEGDVCITCSDEAVRVTVVELLPNGLARVDTGASEEEVSVALVDAAVGDAILVHAKEAIVALGPAEADARVDDTVRDDAGRAASP
jgi:hydrogenase expression/formation protein HypC